MAGNKVTVDITTGIGTLSFPRVFSTTKGKNDKGEDVYDIQFIIPKSQKDDVRALLAAIKRVGLAAYGENWRKYRQPLRDGDKEADDMTTDGKTKGEKYPERLGCFFLTARSSRPIGVVDRSRTPIENPDDLYGGCKGKVNISFFPYNNSGNIGIGCGLNGVQKVADGEAFGKGRPSVESMFDMLDEDEDLGLDEGDEFDEVEEEEEGEAAPVATKTRRAPAKKAAAKKAAAKPVAVEVDEDEDDLFEDLEDDI